MYTHFYPSFAISFVVVFFLVSFSPILRKSTVIAKVVGIATQSFPSTTNELYKFSLIRIGFGLILTLRGFYILYYLEPSSFESISFMLVVLLNIASGIFLIMGVLSQYTLLYLILFQWHVGDQTLNTMTLGNDVAAMLATLLMLSNCGRYLSLDGLLIKHTKSEWIRKILLYYKSSPTIETLSIAKFLALFSYWLICIYSLFMHLNESAWMSGNAGPWLLSNNFMSQYYREFISFFTAGEGYVLLAKVGLWMMLPWYLFILPFVLLGGCFRKYIIIWGILFFCLSAFLLSLGWLGEIEFLLWAAIFWTGSGIANTQFFEVAFDDKCNLCDKTVQFIRRVDIFEQIKLRPISSNIDWLKEKGISKDDALFDLHGVESNTEDVFKGYNFYITLARKVVVLWPAYPVLLAGKWFKLGPIIYRWIALRRRKLFGVCNIPSKKRVNNTYTAATHDLAQEVIVKTVTLHILVLGLFYCISIPSPYIGHKGVVTPLSKAAHMYGITPINVFNLKDLKLAENWFTLSVIEPGGDTTLIPILDVDGARLDYHASDRIYFGKTLRFRRNSIDQEGCLFDKTRYQAMSLANVYLRLNNIEESRTMFRYTQYHQALPDDTLLDKNLFVENINPEIRCSKTFSIP